MSGKQKIYDKLISGNASVQNRYFSFVSSHSRLHGIMPAAAWGYALLLYLKYSVFHFPDRKFGEYSLSAEETATLLCKADAVSYTHLDVYKRQIIISSNDIIEFSIKSVSEKIKIRKTEKIKKAM